MAEATANVVGALRVVFGRHFVSDVVFAAVVTIAIIMEFYRLLLDPVRRNDARLEQAIARAATRAHKISGSVLADAGEVLAHGGSTLRRTGERLQKRIDAVT